MSRIKGRYVAKIILNIDFERRQGMLPLEDMKERFRGFPSALKEIISDETDIDETDRTEVEVLEEYFDLYEVENDEND